MKKIIFTSCIIICTLFLANAQENCKVLLADISGTYSGDCVNGKANGKGESKGKDTYIGEFKNGLPDGKGSYLYSNGDFYNGEWEKGKKEGAGSFSYKRPDKTDSLVVGYWKKDKFFGKYKFQSIVHNSTNQFTSIEIKKSSGNSQNSIVVNLSNTTAGGATLSAAVPLKPTISDILVSKGFIQSTQDLNKGPKTSSKVLMNVTFPFRAKIFSGNQVMDIEISEAGQWTIEAVLNN